MSSDSGPAVGSLLASAAGVGSGVGALGGGAGFMIFVVFAVLDPTKNGGTNGLGLAIFLVFIAMFVGALVGLVSALLLVCALLAADLMHTTMIAFPAAAGLLSGFVMIAWSADLSLVSKLAVGLLSGLASARITQKSMWRTDLHDAARAALRRRAAAATPTVATRWLLLSIAATVVIFTVAALRSNLGYGLFVGVGWVDLTWWARNWTQTVSMVDDPQWWLYVLAYVGAGVSWTVATERGRLVVARLICLALLIECFEATFLWQFASTADIAAAAVGSLVGAAIALRFLPGRSVSAARPAT